MRALLAALASAVALGGCSAVLHFDECLQDADCAGRVDGGSAFCTSDHFCVAQVPDERLCTELDGASPNDPSTVMIGGFFRLTGMAGDKDTEMANAARMAIAEIQMNSQRPIGMVMCDVGFDASAAPRSVDKAAQQYHIVGAVGPTTSSNLLSVAPQFVKYDILLVTPSATSPAITDLNDGLVFRTCANDNVQANELATYIPWDPTNSITPVVNMAYVSTAYGTGLHDAFTNAWVGKTSMAEKNATPFNVGVDANQLLPKLAADHPDYSIFVADDDAANIVQALYGNAGLFGPSTQFLFTDGAKGPDLLGTSPVDSVVARIRGTGPSNPPPPAVNESPSQAYKNYLLFRQSYMAQFNNSDPNTTSFVANTYDATYVVALAVAGSPAGAQPTGSALAQLVTKMDVSNATAVNVSPNDFNKGASALLAGGSIDLTGASGDLTWDQHGDCIDAPIEVWGIDSHHQFCHVAPGQNLCN